MHLGHYTCPNQRLAVGIGEVAECVGKERSGAVEEERAGLSAEKHHLKTHSSRSTG